MLGQQHLEINFWATLLYDASEEGNHLCADFLGPQWSKSAQFTALYLCLIVDAAQVTLMLEVKHEVF